MHGFLSHLHSLMVTMSQKSSVPQAAKSVSQALMSDTVGRRQGECDGANGNDETRAEDRYCPTPANRPEASFVANDRRQHQVDVRQLCTRNCEQQGGRVGRSHLKRLGRDSDYENDEIKCAA